MPFPDTEIITKHLRTILQGSYGLEALALIGINGEEIASALPAGSSVDRVASMTLAAFSLSEQIASELQGHSLEQLFIRGKYGIIVVIPLENRYLLFALARENAKLGLLFLELQRAAAQLLAL